MPSRRVWFWGLEFGFMGVDVGLGLREETHGFYQLLMTPGWAELRRGSIQGGTGNSTSPLASGDRTPVIMNLELVAANKPLSFDG
jgi:hypothetical protein